MLLDLSYHLTQARLHIESAIEQVKEGDTISAEDALLLARMTRKLDDLRTAMIRHDVQRGETLKAIAAKHRLSVARISQIANKEDDEESAPEEIDNIVACRDTNLLELAPLAITDVRGVNILETMRKKIAEGARPGITVIGPHVTIRFNGPEKNMQSVSMQVVSIVDSNVKDEDE